MYRKIDPGEYVYVHVYVHVHMYVYGYVCMYMYAYVYVYVWCRCRCDLQLLLYFGKASLSFYSESATFVCIQLLYFTQTNDSDGDTARPWAFAAASEPRHGW